MKIDKVNPGAWFASKFADRLSAEKVMVQKSGYYSRSAPANQRDLELIKLMTDLAVDSALQGEPGVIGHDEERDDELTSDRVRPDQRWQAVRYQPGLVRHSAEEHRSARRRRRGADPASEAAASFQPLDLRR